MNAWWVIHEDDLLGMLREVRDGGDPDVVLIEHYANDCEEVG